MADVSPSRHDRGRRHLTPLRDGGEPIRVVIADDHVVLRQALRLLLENYDQVQVVGDASDGREAVEVAERLQPDVVLMDLAMPGLNGVEATRQIVQRLRDVKVLILTGYVDDDRILEALRAGASGYVIKRSDINELLLAIQSVHRGNPFFSASISAGRSPVELLVAARTRLSGPGENLTPREREILQLIAEGYPNQGIADRLVLSVKTVEAHKAHIMAKLGAQKTTDLIRYALRKGIISLDNDLGRAQ